MSSVFMFIFIKDIIDFVYADSKQFTDIDFDTYDNRDCTDKNNTNEPLSLSNSNSTIYKMLQGGHGLNEPYLQVRTYRRSNVLYDIECSAKSHCVCMYLCVSKVVPKRCKVFKLLIVYYFICISCGYILLFEIIRHL